MTRAAQDLASLVPQVGTARMVESVLELRDDGIDCGGRIPPGHPLVRGGGAPSFVGLELAAQAAAVFEALRCARPEGESDHAARRGLLVSLRDVRLERPELPAGCPLVASLRVIGGASALALYEARVFHDGALALAGTLGAYLREASPPSVGRAR